MIRFAEIAQGKLQPLDTSKDWLDLNLENRSLYLHRHPLNRLSNASHPSALALEKHLREAEKSIKRVLDRGWVLFDDFIQGVLVPLTENSTITLKRNGKHWKFATPQYTDEEKILIKTAIFDWLFELGMTAKGSLDGRECFCVTPLGRIFFES